MSNNKWRDIFSARRLSSFSQTNSDERWKSPKVIVARVVKENGH